MLIAAALLLAQTAPAPACSAIDAGLPVALAGWTRTMAHPGLMPGHATLIEAANGTANADFRIDTAGTYGIALDQAGWIDVLPVGASAPLKSSKHGHGPACSSIRKIVRFDLAPGSYRLALTNLKQGRAKVMLVKD